ncbi:MAG: Fic family protein [Nanoarchaeota archaeon]|jgi:hypothetical protein|nr:Fic family protein [Nanoarchaeota archaeon]
MPTKYDVFAKIIEKAPISARGLLFKTPVYNHILELEKEFLIKKKNNLLTPLNNDRSKKIFEIIKWSLKNGVNYNIWFKKNMVKIIEQLSSASTKIQYAAIKGNAKNLELINFLSSNQFLLIHKKTPKLGTLLNHSIFERLKELNMKKFKIHEKYLNFENISSLVLRTKKQVINPFGTKICEFLTGSAQLEGSTITIGETVELLTKNIYPNKPAEDIQMVKNLNIAFGYSVENLEEDLSIGKIKKINELCLFGIHKGGGILKKNQNKIQGNPSFKVAAPEETPLKLEKFCNEFNSIKSREEAILRIGYIHNEFQHIHPFVDGNSRTTRILVNWLIIKFSLPLLILKAGAFEKYMSLTKLSKKRDDDNLGIFLMHVIYHEYLSKN